MIDLFKGKRRDSNSQQSEPQTDALPIELRLPYLNYIIFNL